MRPSATLNRLPWPPGGAEEPCPTLTQYLCKELFVVLLGVRQGGARQASFLSLVGEGGLAISASGLLNIYAVLWVLSLWAPETPF